MASSPAFDDLQRVRHVAQWCERTGASSEEGVVLAGEAEPLKVSRRRFLAGAAAAAAATAAGGFASGAGRAWAAPPPTDLRVAIVGAGLAGLACAEALHDRGVPAVVYEASERVGGRLWSLDGVFPGQVAERGPEFIDSAHATVRNYAARFRLRLEDVTRRAGRTRFHLRGRPVDEAEVVEEYRALVPAMRADVKTLTPPTAEVHTEADEALDWLTLADWLDSRGAGPLVTAAIEAAYIGGYGCETSEQSSLNFLLWAHADRRSSFTPFGVFGDERLHVIDGNERIAERLGEQVSAIEHARRLVAAKHRADGTVRLFFESSAHVDCDAVVLAVPFSVLRTVDLTGLSLPDWKQHAIDTLHYGTNSKLIVGFEHPVWRDQGASGLSFADLGNLQGTWETNPSRATADRAVLTSYEGGDLGAAEPALQPAAEDFLSDAGALFPGVASAARRDDDGNVLAHREHWLSNPLALGSYPCNQPGYFTTIADNEGKPIGNVFFAGDHASSFYEWQGYMEGAASSGVAAARQILAARRSRTL